MRLEFHPEALTEYKAAAQYYESVRKGLGARFIDAVEVALQRVAESPQCWREIDDGIRRCLTRVFPYAVLYSIEAQSILIVAIMHLARKPGYWKSRR